MKHFPRWRGLKHFNEVTTIEYTDGQTFLDILKVTATISLTFSEAELFRADHVECFKYSASCLVLFSSFQRIVLWFIVSELISGIVS